MTKGLYHFNIILFLLLLSVTAKAQLIIKGLITDRNGQPVPNATVIFKPIGEANANGAITKANGNYSIHIKPNTAATLCVSYVSASDTCIAVAGILKDTTINIVLTNKNVLLKNVVVKSETPTKMDTTGFAVDSIKKLYHRNIEALLNEIPGLQFINGALQYKGKNVTKLLFEGDNLTGSDYKRIIKNLSTNGLDSIQIIENYVDKTELGNFYKKYGDEVVINFTFKGKKKLRNYGRTYAGIGLPGGVYEAKLDDIALLHKFKSITLANKNNMGNTNVYLFNTSGAIIPVGFNTINALHPLSTVERQSYEIAIADISPYFLGADRIYTNKTLFLTNDFYSRVSKNAFIRGNIGYSNEQLKQNINENNIYFDTGFVNTYSRDNSMKKNVPVNITTTLSWLLNPTIQYSSTLTVGNNPGNTLLNGIINNEGSLAIYKSSQQNWLHTHNLTKLYNKNNQLKMQFFYGKNSITESNNRISGIYKSFFSNDSITSANQSIINSDKFTGAVVNYNFSAKRKLSLDLFTGMLLQKYKLNSLLTAFNTQHVNIPIGAGFSNNNSYKQGTWYASVKAAKAIKIFNRSINLYFDPILQYNTFSVLNAENALNKKYSQKLSFLPNGRMSFKLFKNFSLQGSYTVTNYITHPVTYYDGAILKNQTSLFKGNDSVVTYNSSNTSITLNINGKKGKLLLLSYHHGFSPMMGMVNVKPTGLFMFLLPSFINKPVYFNSLNLNGSILIKKMYFNINANGSINKSVYAINNAIYKNSRFSPYVIINVSTFGTKNISQKLEIDWQASFQKSSTSLGNISRNSDQFIKVGHEINFAFKKAYTVSLNQKYILVNSSQSNTNRYYFIDIFASRTLKNDRFTFFINGKNLLNQTKFVQVFTSAYSQSQTYSSILPCMILAGVEIKF